MQSLRGLRDDGNFVSMTEEYTQYLESLHWAKLREVSFENAQHRCEGCSEKRRLHGHHLRYRSPLTDCTTDDIMALCERCHDIWHKWLKESGLSLSMFCRASTRGAIQVLIRPLESERKKAVMTTKTSTQKCQEELQNDPIFLHALSTLTRKKFKQWARKYFTGASRTRFVANAITIFDGRSRHFQRPKKPVFNPKPRPTHPRIEKGIYRIS